MPRGGAVHYWAGRGGGPEALASRTVRGGPGPQARGRITETAGRGTFPSRGSLWEVPSQPGWGRWAERIFWKGRVGFSRGDLGPILNVDAVSYECFTASSEPTPGDRNKACAGQECRLRQGKAGGSGRQDFGRGADPGGEEDSESGRCGAGEDGCGRPARGHGVDTGLDVSGTDSGPSGEAHRPAGVTSGGGQESLGPGGGRARSRHRPRAAGTGSGSHPGDSKRSGGGAIALAAGAAGVAAWEGGAQEGPRPSPRLSRAC